MEPVNPELPLLYEKRVSHPTEIGLAAYCDTHDLIATVSQSTGDVVIYRLNGQVAFTIKSSRKDADVTVLKWKPDGSLLGLGWTDGLCGVYSGEDGRLVSQSSVIDLQEEQDWRLDLAPDFEADSQTVEDMGDEGRVATCIGWTTYLRTSEPSMKANGHSNSIGEDSLNGERADMNALNRAITTLDITKVMPKLSAIPSHGARSGPHGSKFGSQTGVDSVFDTSISSSESTETLVTAGASGYTNLLIDESVKIGSLKLPGRPFLHASHSSCSSQAILAESSYDQKFLLHHIDLPIESLGSPLLQVIARNTKQYQNLSAYIAQTVRCIEHDFKTGLQFPSRLLTNISEELSKKGEGDLVTNLYHLAMTGSFTPTILEWLIDVVKESNLKRWDQAVSGMYNNIRDHLFINLLPALDRLSIAASALCGHARLHEGTGKFDVSAGLFTILLDHVDALRLVVQKLLLVIMTEYRQFRAFSKWMRVMIEVGVAGPGSKGAVEAEEREMPNLDYGLLLAYIKDTMDRSSIAKHIETLPDMKGSCNKDDFFRHPVIAQMTHENTTAALKALDSLKPGEGLEINGLHDPFASVNLPALTTRLLAQIRLALDSITTWQSTMIPRPTTEKLFTSLDIDSGVRVFDMRMFRHGERVASITDLLTSSPPGEKSDGLHFYRFIRLTDSKNLDFTKAEFELPAGEIIHAKMFGSTKYIVLFKHDDDGRFSLLLCYMEEYERQRVEGKGFKQSKWLETLHIFDSGFTPASFVIGGRRGKMVIVVFSSQGQEWKIYDLEGHGDANGASSEGERMQV